MFNITSGWSLCTGVKILNNSIEELVDSEKFDVIIFSHSFEHLPDQLEALRKVSA